MKRPIIMRFGLQRVLLLAVVVGATSACIPPRLSDPTAIDASGDVEQGKDLSGGSCAIDDDCPAGDNPCLKPVCQKARSGGRECAFKSKTNGTDCDDNDPCTAVSTCSKGKCEGGGNQCQCEADNKDNCYKQFQGLYSKTNKCLSLADCAVEKGTGIWKCVPQAPPIQCPTDSDNSCQTNTCNTGTGQCQLIKKKPGYACEDGIACGESACDAKGSCSMVSYAGCGCNPQNGVPEGNICWNREYSIDGTKYTTSYASRKCTGEILCLPVTEDGKTKYDCVLDMFTIKFCGEDDSACIDNVCIEKDGTCAKKILPKDTPCDDGNPCTVNDYCDGALGACIAQTQICSCKNDKDCASKEDGDLCNGTLYCDKKSGKCTVNPATVVTCPSVGDTDCLVNVCVPNTGKCVVTPRENIKNEYSINPSTQAKKLLGKTIYSGKQISVFCDDGAKCSVNDECASGKCQGGVSICTCQSDAECAVSDAKRSDGSADLCAGKHYCDKLEGKCKINPATVVTCIDTDDNSCTTTSCDPKAGNCVVKPLSVANMPCDDGDKCTSGDVCDITTGTCASGTVVCGCNVDSDCTAKEDGDLCNGTLYCDKSVGYCKVNPATIVSCPSVLDSECLKNQCVPLTGKCVLKPANEGLTCKAETPCAASPVCVSGKCDWSANLCNCKQASDCDHLTGGNKCLGTAICDQGLCALKDTTPPCQQDPSRPCELNTCDPATGKCSFVNRPNFTPCSDGDVCTVSDGCQGGKCKAGSDVCLCTSDSDCSKFNAVDDKCAGSYTCSKNSAVDNKTVKYCTNTPKVCPSGGSGCTLQTCDPDTGKCQPNEAGKCNDGNSCTLDVCGADGKCKHNVSATKGQPCTSAQTGMGLCDIKGTCVPAPLSDLILIPGGISQIGCDPSADSTCPPNEKPHHAVDIPTFWMQRYEVTVSDYLACVNSQSANKCTASGADTSCTVGKGNGDLPVNCVSHKQAQTYCTWLNAEARLPTEAEWERAARGGCEIHGMKKCASQSHLYVWGNSPLPDCMRVIYKSKNGVPGCGLKGPWPVGARPSGDVSVYGVYDMGGNVSEWVSDFYDAQWYSSTSATGLDQGGPATGQLRTVRGASFGDNSKKVRTTHRQGVSPILQSPQTGFRCVIPAQ